VNVTSARIVKLEAHSVSPRVLLPTVRPVPRRAVQIFAQVNVHYRRIGGSPNGVDSFFIYVVKERVTSPWRIAGIGSGP
jgi:hypothetical protein